MSAEAQAKLQQLWEKLDFSFVKRTIAREPEDVIHMELMPPDRDRPGRVKRVHQGEVIRSNRSADVPARDRWRLQVTWRHFFGFTHDNVYFAQGGHLVFDFGLGLYPEINHEDGWLDHSGIYNYRPSKDSVIAGVIGEGAKGRRFDRWFRCSRQYKLMVELIRKGEPFPAYALARHLFVRSGGYGDTYWVFANLLLNDDISPFVDRLLEPEDRRPYPAATMVNSFGETEKEDACISLAGNPTTWLHELSRILNEPGWWQEFQRQTADKGVKPIHHELGGACMACRHEGYGDELAPW